MKNHGDGNLKIASTATPIILGTPNSMTSSDDAFRSEIEDAYKNGVRSTNPKTLGDFIPEVTASPHPRFLGLAQSIRERRGEKVKILSPIYRDKNTLGLETSTPEEPFPG